MPKIQIRSAVATDINTLIAFDHSSQTEYVWQMDVQRDETQTLVLFREIRLPRPVVISYPRPVAALSETWSRNSGILIALREDKIVGYGRMNDTLIQKTALLTDVVVSMPHRRQGVATALVLAAQTWASNRNNQQMIMEMITKNIPAIRLAQKLGLEFSGYNNTYYETKEIALFFGRSI